jgi:hypothetical protein
VYLCVADHYLVPPSAAYQREKDPSAFRVREWPAVFTLNCPDVTPLVRGGKPPGMDRGLLIAHKVPALLVCTVFDVQLLPSLLLRRPFPARGLLAVCLPPVPWLRLSPACTFLSHLFPVPPPLLAQETWDQFIRQREANVNRQAFSETADILVVFEDDVYATVPDIKTAMVAEIENMESDIKYLGWCMWNDHNMVRGLCHATCLAVLSYPCSYPPHFMLSLATGAIVHARVRDGRARCPQVAQVRRRVLRRPIGHPGAPALFSPYLGFYLGPYLALI